MEHKEHYIDMKEIELIAIELKKKSSSIYSEFSTKCLPALKNGEECLKVSGVDVNYLYKELNTIYSNMSQSINLLGDVLINNVISKYKDFDNEVI